MHTHAALNTIRTRSFSRTLHATSRMSAPTSVAGRSTRRTGRGCTWAACRGSRMAATAACVLEACRRIRECVSMTCWHHVNSCKREVAQILSTAYGSRCKCPRYATADLTHACHDLRIHVVCPVCRVSLNDWQLMCGIRAVDNMHRTYDGANVIDRCGRKAMACRPGSMQCATL
eukprot:364664-Chlamydomonas_euryale.AAC.12